MATPLDGPMLSPGEAPRRRDPEPRYCVKEGPCHHKRTEKPVRCEAYGCRRLASVGLVWKGQHWRVCEEHRPDKEGG